MSGLVARYAQRQGNFELDVDLELPGSGITGVFGQSGAGKTTLLRCMAGLESARLAYLSINGRVLDDSAKGVKVSAHDRRLGVVFQEPRLFDHLDVRGNLAYGTRRRSGDPISSFDDIVDLLGIGTLLDRRPAGLSGGEAQRVAIGRALLCNPALVLMDEPLSSLDRARREEILPFLEALHRSLPVPMLYVSHQPDEILRLADFAVVMDGGAVNSSGPIGELLANAGTSLPAAVVLSGVAARNDPEYGLAEIASDAGPIWVTANYRPGTALRLIVRANDVSIAKSAPENSSIQNIVPATIASLRPENTATVLISLTANGAPLLARVTRRAIAELGLQPGDGVFAQIKTVAVRNAGASENSPP